MSEKVKILLVDDERDILEVFTDILTDLEYSIEQAIGYDEAVEILDRVKIDLVITDVRMPGKDGIELLKTIKSKNKDIPVLVSSGFTDYKTDEILGLGAFAFLRKPLSFTDLTSAVESALAK